MIVLVYKVEGEEFSTKLAYQEPLMKIYLAPPIIYCMFNHTPSTPPPSV